MLQALWVNGRWRSRIASPATRIAEMQLLTRPDSSGNGANGVAGWGTLSRSGGTGRRVWETTVMARAGSNRWADGRSCSFSYRILPKGSGRLLSVVWITESLWPLCVELEGLRTGRWQAVNGGLGSSGRARMPLVIRSVWRIAFGVVPG